MACKRRKGGASQDCMFLHFWGDSVFRSELLNVHLYLTFKMVKNVEVQSFGLRLPQVIDIWVFNRICDSLVISSDVSKTIWVSVIAIVPHIRGFFSPFLTLQMRFFLHKSAFCQLVSLKIIYMCMKQCYDVFFYASVSIYWVFPMSGERGFWFAGVCFQSTNFQCRKINSIKKKNNKKPLDCYESFSHSCQWQFTLYP